MSIKNMLMASFLLIGSCDNQGKTSPEITEDTSAASITTNGIKDSLPSGCYSQIVGRDTSLLQLENKDSSVNGPLSYNIYQKDRNDGTVQAEMEGNILKGWYLFRSEGIVSVRQVAWKISGSELWPATGEVIQHKDTTRFVGVDKLKYDSSHPFRKTPCVM